MLSAKRLASDDFQMFAMVLGSRLRATRNTSVAEKCFHVSRKSVSCVLHARQAIASEAEAKSLAPDHEFLENYRPYPQDELGKIHSLFYRFIESIRYKLGKGRRPLALEPGAAGLSIDASAIVRLCSDPADHEEMSAPYRPESLVELARRHQDDADKYIRRFGLDPASHEFPNDI